MQGDRRRVPPTRRNLDALFIARKETKSPLVGWNEWGSSAGELELVSIYPWATNHGWIQSLRVDSVIYALVRKSNVY